MAKVRLTISTEEGEVLINKLVSDDQTGIDMEELAEEVSDAVEALGFEVEIIPAIPG